MRTEQPQALNPLQNQRVVSGDTPMQGRAAAGESKTQEVVARCATGSKSTGHATWQELSCACLCPLLKCPDKNKE